MSNHNVLRFLCVSSMIFLCHGVYADNGVIDAEIIALADLADINSTSGVYIRDNTYTVSNAAAREFVRVQLDTLAPAPETATDRVEEFICGPNSTGYYVAACNNYRVGFNWLKSAKVPDLEQSSPDSYQIVYHTTGDYYGNDDDMITLLKKMRIFFGHYQDLSLINTPENTLSKDRESILNNICNPNDSNTEIYCAKCPNDAKIPLSSVKLDSNHSVISGSWKFYTIADCYMDTFEDSTGTYFYVPDSMNLDEVNAGQAQKCYYANTNPDALDALKGDAIGQIALGITKKEPIQKDTMIPITSGINK